MIVKQIYTYNNYRNFNYLVACPITREAIAIDPLAYDLVLKEALQEDLKIVAIINTHEHMDHIGGNENIIMNTECKLYAHKNAKNKIPNVDYGLSAGDVLKFGKSLEIQILDTPGHTMSHVCLLVRGEVNSLFCGDTLFNAGVGNCHNGGDPISLYETFYNQLIKLEKNTKIYPGHDYLKNNLEFTLSLEPNNKNAYKLLKQGQKENFSINYVSSLNNELKINTFFRLKQKEIIESLKEKGEDLKDTSPKEVFLALRRLRNKW
ncbi:MAG: Hydroxyacylglutathione hydrolase [Alphaproteobacteria bacterium MarineAlpha9_Bin4]|nr:hydroxyacylglutathione hydrolase [Pelagibacterales bacterium]PPR27653.1 MAG: Hydroxyacylglutathione hydrolase [Alphaproteobacteria bacterium MarineAlpha9_Bin4]|tara:strand:+ start:1476 stop:2264 length:789 start_codon:yes stop_codon:yes gene_type:complete